MLAHRRWRSPLPWWWTPLLCMCVMIPLAPSASSAQERARTGSPLELRVGVAGAAPFVVDVASGDGISLEIWQKLAARLGWRYTLVPFTDVPHAVQSMTDGNVDVVVGPVSITAERADEVRFTQPYFQSSLSILSRSEAPTWWERLRPFFSRHFFIALGVFMLILGVVGALIWLAEREENPEQFPAAPASGIANGMWCAIVTMSTTGYGDRAPITLWGRIVTSVWIIISLLGATTMIAGIASTLTLSGMNATTISTAAGLAGRSVGVVAGSPAELFIGPYGARKVSIESPAEGYELLKAGRVDAVVYDRPQLLYFLKEHHDGGVAVSAAEYARQGYGFVLPLGSPLAHQADVALLRLEESGSVQRIISGWLGDVSAR